MRLLLVKFQLNLYLKRWEVLNSHHEMLWAPSENSPTTSRFTWAWIDILLHPKSTRCCTSWFFQPITTFTSETEHPCFSYMSYSSSFHWLQQIFFPHRRCMDWLLRFRFWLEIFSNLPWICKPNSPKRKSGYMYIFKFVNRQFSLLNR